MERYYNSVRRIAFDEGKAEAIKIITQRLREMGLSEEQILEATSI